MTKLKKAAKAAQANPDAPPNAEFLAKALIWLDKATMDESIDFYKSTYNMPGCDDWLLAELGRKDLFFLLVHPLNRPDVQHPWVYDRIREVERQPYGTLDLWAREHYKSTIKTFALNIQDILSDPEVTIAIFSHTRPVAKGFMRQIKQEFEQNETLKALYSDVLWQNPKTEAPKWSEDDGIVVRRKGNTKESTVEAWGLVDGQPIGKHFRILDYDDIVVPASVTTPEMLAKTTSSLELSYSLGTEDGQRKFTGTRYHFNDPYKVVLERKTAKLRLYDGTEGNSGDITKPVLFSPELMAEKRRDMGLYTFSCQILQNPKGDTARGFKREWLQHWRPDDGKGMNKILLVDPANAKKKKSDYTTMWVIGLGHNRGRYVLAMVRDRLNLEERTKWVFDLHQKWEPYEVRYEEYGLQTDISHLEGEMSARKYHFKIKKVGGTTGKGDRIDRLIPIFEQGKLFLPHSYHVTDRNGDTRDLVHDFIEDEYMAWPVPVHDDMLDALARLEEPDTKSEKYEMRWPKAPKPRVHIPSMGVPRDSVVGI